MSAMVNKTSNKPILDHGISEVRDMDDLRASRDQSGGVDLEVILGPF